MFSSNTSAIAASAIALNAGPPWAKTGPMVSLKLPCDRGFREAVFGHMKPLRKSKVAAVALLFTVGQAMA